MNIPRYIEFPFKYLRENHDMVTIKNYVLFEDYSKKLVCLKERLHFLHRCKREGFIPKSLRVKNLVGGWEGEKVSRSTEKRFLTIGIRKLHYEIKSKEDKINGTILNLESNLERPHCDILKDYVRRRIESVRQRVKENLINKFEILRDSVCKKKNNMDTTKKWVKNLSDRILNQDELSLLSKGMKFAVSSRIDFSSFIAPIEKALSDLPEEDGNKIRLSVVTCLNSKKENTDNLSKRERKVLRDLRMDPTIMITNADKGKTTVVMNTKDYNAKLDDLLFDDKTYEVVEKDPTNSIQNKMNQMLLTYKNKQQITNEVYNKIRCTNGTIPKFYGLPKLHKENIPLRPIVSYLTSPCYNLSRYLSEILGKYSINEHSVKTSQEFSTMIRKERLEDGEVCVSFDVVSLFTSIPIDMACSAALEFLQKDDHLKERCALPPDDIKKLLELCLCSTTFISRGNLYRQKFGTAMGSPVSSTVANMVMIKIEEEALSSFKEKPRIWKRYVDDTFAIIKKNRVKSFLEHLNSINQNIRFTMEMEANGKIPFLDVLVSHNSQGKFKTSVFRKPTHTDRLLDFHSNHPMCNKTSTIKTLFKRAEIISSDKDLEKEEKEYLLNVFRINNYPDWIVNLHSKQKQYGEKKMETNKRICLPYIQGLSETTKRLLKNYGFDCIFQPSNTLTQLLSHPKDRSKVDSTTNLVYSIPCSDCDKCYIGQTKRCLKTRLHEHKNNIIKMEVNKSAVANHVINEQHEINWNDTRVLHKNKGTFERLFLEGWEIKKRRNTTFDKNRGTPIPDIYNVLIGKEKKKEEIT